MWWGWLLQVHRIGTRRKQHQLHLIPTQICTWKWAADLASYIQQMTYPPIVMTLKCDMVPLKCDMIPLGQALCSVRRISQLCSDVKPSPEEGRCFTFVIAVRIRICEALWVYFPFESGFFSDVKRRGQIPTSVRNPTYSFFLATLWS